MFDVPLFSADNFFEFKVRIKIAQQMTLNMLPLEHYETPVWPRHLRR
jgi:hypothetical protein